MTEANSPYFAAGLLDGAADKALADLDPPEPATNYQADKGWSVMYNRGYDQAFAGGGGGAAPTADEPGDVEVSGDVEVWA